jgi:hypothetical protein
MKTSTIIFLLPLLAHGAVVKLGENFDPYVLDNWLIEFLERRQSDLFGGLSSIITSATQGLMNSMAPKRKAFKIEELTPRNPGAKRIRMTWGPLKVKGANVSTKVG